MRPNPRPYNTLYAPAEASAGGFPGYASATGQRLCYSPSYEQWVLDSKHFDPADNTCVAGIDAKAGPVLSGAPQAGGSRGVFDPFDPFEHLLTSFHTILRVRFGGHLPPSPSFRPL